MRLRRYPREWLVLALVALAALPIVNPPNTQDASRLALTNSILLRGEVDIDPYRHLTGDRSYYRGHWYTDKAPGVSLAVLPPVAALRLVDRARGANRHFPVWLRETHLWLIRLWAGGIPFLALVFLVGRVAEGLAPRTGAATAVTFGLGTMLGSLAPTTFGHLPAALLLFGAFLVATRATSARAWAAVGLLAGLAVLFEYPAALAAPSRPARSRRPLSSARTTSSRSGRPFGSRTRTSRTHSPSSSAAACSGSARRRRAARGSSSWTATACCSCRRWSSPR